MAYADRIKEVRKVVGRDLLKNENNWRIHPQSQLDNLSSILSSVGKVGALIAWESPDGLTLLDGHGRVELAPDDVWTVLILDITSEDEATKILTTFDPIASLAHADEDKLVKLLATLREDAISFCALDVITSAYDGIDVNDLNVPPDIHIPGSISEVQNIAGYEQQKNQTVCPTVVLEFGSVVDRFTFLSSIFPIDTVSKFEFNLDIARRLRVTTQMLDHAVNLYRSNSEEAL